MEQATVGGGCFWCVEAVYARMEGIEAAVSGYAGGTKEKPTYEEVCTGRTGHAEVVQITFDPARLSYQDILDIFFKAHDPTTLDRQGADVGTQYRSIILYHTEEQRKVAEATVARLAKSGKYHTPIVTKIEPLKIYWPAEEYHQGYYERNPTQGYCAAVIAPKLGKMGLQVAPLREP